LSLCDIYPHIKEELTFFCSSLALELFVVYQRIVSDQLVRSTLNII